jgi:hypothetical protein
LVHFDRLIQNVLKDSDGFVSFIISTVEEVYTLLDTLIEEIEIVLDLAVEEVPFHEGEKMTLLTFPNFDIPSVPNELTSDLAYLKKMKQMDEEIVDQWKSGNREFKKVEMSHVVPVSGLIVGKVQMIAMELETAIEIWGHIKTKRDEDLSVNESAVTPSCPHPSSPPQPNISAQATQSGSFLKSLPSRGEDRSKMPSLERSPSMGHNRRKVKMTSRAKDDASVTSIPDYPDSSRRRFRNVFAASPHPAPLPLSNSDIHPAESQSALISLRGLQPISQLNDSPNLFDWKPHENISTHP